MAVAIRLARRGKRTQPHYNIIVQDKEKSPKGGYIEKLGYFEPYTNPSTLVLDGAKTQEWIKNGAQPSERVAKLIVLAGGKKIEPKVRKAKKNFGGKFVKAAPVEAPKAEVKAEAPKS